MCLLFFSYKMMPGYKLVVAANRDEFLQRPTAPLGYIDSKGHILAGRDLQAGGTWLGISRADKFAALTNFRDSQKTKVNAPSRGDIISSYLGSKLNATDFLAKLSETSSAYNGFNLILSDRNDLFYYSNRQTKPLLLEPGFYGLCNSFLDTPWPKLTRGKKLLRFEMVETKRINHSNMLKILRDDWCPPDDQLPTTGIGLEWERVLGSVFIDSPQYGTRSSAVITMADKGEIVFSEKTYSRGAEQKNEIVQFGCKLL